MRILYLNGGLGNQLFQYIFGRYLEIATGERVFFDDSFFFSKVMQHNGYEIERLFNVEPQLLSRQFTTDVWEHMLENCRAGIGICQQLSDNGMNIFMIAETDNFKFDGNQVFVPANEFSPYIAKTKGNVYYHGYWINKHWFSSIKDTIMKELVFPPLEDPINKRYQEEIESKPSIGVHIRRGDFLTLSWCLPTDYYFNSMEAISKEQPNAWYFIFSDEPDWCKEYASELGFDFAKGRICYIEGNMDGRNYIDLQLMTLCKGLIMSNSSFSYLAALMSVQPSFYGVNPTSREV